MNYFELFGLQVKVNIDLATLRQKYIALQMGNHPDLEIGDEDASTQINQAYETLRDKESRLNYILNLYSMDIALENDKAWLMEMMDWNERIEEAEGNEKETAGLNKELIEFEQTLWNAIEKIDVVGELNTNKLAEINQLYFKTKFIKRLQKILNKENEI